MYKFSKTKFKELCIVRQVICDISDEFDQDVVEHELLAKHKFVKSCLIKESILNPCKYVYWTHISIHPSITDVTLCFPMLKLAESARKHAGSRTSYV